MGSTAEKVRWPRVSWHRGGLELAPSATRDAFVAAARHGAEFIEVDVRRSADGVLLCVHDASLAGLGRVEALNVGLLSHEQRAGVLSLAEFLDDLDEVDPHRLSGIHLDLKETGYEVAAADVVHASGREFFATSTFDSSIRSLRSLRPSYSAYLTIGRSREGLSRVATIRLRVSETVPFARIARCGATGIAVHYRLASPWTRWWCRRRHLAIVVWTVDKPAFVESWLSRDVDVVTTNRPLFAVRRRRALAELARQAA